jgi:hypothetical protein
VLKGVATEPSEPSGLETVRFFKLIEDLFFRRNVGLELGILWPPGELDSSLMDGGRPGVAGLMVKAVSDGLNRGRDPAETGSGGI